MDIIGKIVVASGLVGLTLHSIFNGFKSDSSSDTSNTTDGAPYKSNSSKCKNNWNYKDENKKTGASKNYNSDYGKATNNYGKSSSSKGKVVEESPGCSNWDRGASYKKHNSDYDSWNYEDEDQKTGASKNYNSDYGKATNNYEKSSSSKEKVVEESPGCSNWNRDLSHKKYDSDNKEKKVTEKSKWKQSDPHYGGETSGGYWKPSDPYYEEEEANGGCGEQYDLDYEEEYSDSYEEEYSDSYEEEYSDSYEEEYSDSYEEYGLSDLLPVPSNWYWNCDDIEETLSPNNSEYKKVQSMLKGIPLQNFTCISRIQNSYLYHRYMIRKLEYKSLKIKFSERVLFHATAESRIPFIIEDNLNWRLVKRAKFGKGVSFSPDCKYANSYCNKSIGSKRALIIATVLVGKKCVGDYSTVIPPRKFDTTTGNGNKVLVKFYDDEFYPQYVVYYDTN